jgi:hypothetical protein
MWCKDQLEVTDGLKGHIGGHLYARYNRHMAMKNGRFTNKPNHRCIASRPVFDF